MNRKVNECIKIHRYDHFDHRIRQRIDFFAVTRFLIDNKTN